MRQLITFVPAPPSLTPDLPWAHGSPLPVARRRGLAPETIGDAVSENVELHPIPPDVAAKVPQVKSHEFLVKDDKIILVSPSDRRTADVIQKAE